MLTRTALAVAIGAIVLVAPLAASPARAATASAPVGGAPADAVAVAPKVVIVVGATEGTTPSYRAMADTIATEALKWTPNVIKVYSPNATWALVKAAAQGASVFVYLGHGYGWPSPYTTVMKPDSQNGMGLNTVAGVSDSTKTYYGENYVDGGIRFAPNAVVFLEDLCYAPGAGEPGAPDPTVDVAEQRVDNFASGFIRAGARTVMAGDGNYVPQALDALFTTHAPILSIWRLGWIYNGNEIPFMPVRNPAFQGILDPQTWTTGFQHSIVADPTLTTDAVLAGAGVGLTNVPPTGVAAPGAASVLASGLAVAASPDLADPTGVTLAAGTKVRVDDVVQPPAAPDGSVPPPAVQVHTLDAAVSGWVSGDGLQPGDDASPGLWSMTGGTTVSPNFDGASDKLYLWGRLSEPLPWTWTLQDPGGTPIRTLTGSGDAVTLSWDALPGAVPATAGTYHWTLQGDDGWGNAPLDASGDVTVVDEPVPPTAVLAFRSLKGGYTSATELAFQLTFATGVTGLTAGDIARSGTATACAVGAPTGGPTTWYVTVTGCSAGTLALTLAAGSVLDTTSTSGPSIAVASPTVRIDRTKPTTSAPTTSFRSATLVGSTMALNVTWSASDSGGAGLSTYDVARSTDGGAFATVQTGLTAASFATTGLSGHGYRFEVRARDRAGNVGAWMAGPTLKPSLVQQSTPGIAWAGAWTTHSSTVASGGSVRSASATGASVSYTFTGRAIAAVAQRDPAFGQVKVYIDGAYVTTVDTFGTGHVERQVVYQRALTWGSHTIKLVLVGTAGRPTVALDAFEVLR